MIKEIKGDKVPALGFGTWRLEGKEGEKAVADALEIGYRHIDTAQAYDNEEFVGNAIKASGIDRDEIFLTTKAHWDHLEPDELISRFNESLEKLKTDYVDLFLIHWPSPQGVPTKETLQAMLELSADRKTRHIGVSNFPPVKLREALEHAELYCNQVEYHPFLDQTELLNIAEEHDMLVTAYCPLARGKAMDENDLQVIAKKHGKTPAQVALRWLIQQKQVSAIPKASSPEHRKANFQIFDFELSDEDMKTINKFDRKMRLINPEFAPEW
ncbi:aldo/keto reductase [Fulvivirga sp. RKSG066]|uniref:aldo/keto reductase n=1 Tax=Fulvivirga aurantia TaxID=2529383 RepID=UPI0012BCB376|nr:aldo/keto reductase [Fulvivirga aurantia]MTI21555.1 aldo/keto reductase [Fulvivirga aurantia]